MATQSVAFASILVGLLHGLGGFCCAGVAPIAGPRRGSHGTPDFLSHDTGRRAFHVLPGGWTERRADAPLAARISLFEHVEPLFARLADRYHLVAPDYPGFGHSDWPDPKAFNYTFDHIASVMDDCTQSMGLSHYTLYMQDYGGPVGFHMALAHPEWVDALIV
jgi:pimeloyl-ACP methyl ester carboxylesterase